MQGLKRKWRPLAQSILLSLALNAEATVRYVDANNTTPTPPYTNWSSAALTIQDAIDAAADGDQILVTNGVYQTGARDVYGMSNRVAVTKVLTVRSVNGPGVTTIVGHPPPGPMGSGGPAVQCVYLTNGAVLAGFTLTNGVGGVSCQSWSAVVSNCVLVGNSANSGGGAYSGTLYNCLLRSNSASYGGGADGAKLNNCTLTANSATFSGGGASGSTLNNCILTGNSAPNGGGAGSGLFGGSCTLNNCALTGNSATSSGGGAYSGTLNNCTVTGNSAVLSGGGVFGGAINNSIVYYNTAPDGNYGSGTFNCSCTTPRPLGGTNNLAAEPGLASFSHLSAGSPCRAAGSTAYTSGSDIDGEPWAGPPSIGCDEYWSGSATGALSAAIMADYTNVAVGFAVNFQALIGGQVSVSSWDFGDGVVLSNQPYASHAWSASGDYAVVLRAYNESYPGGVSATVALHVVTQAVHYVAVGSSSPVSPYSSWATAATNIQDAVDVAVAGDQILVTNGIYQTGGRVVYGISNRVAVTKPLTVQSVNGPGVTVIGGYQVPGVTNGFAAVRCVYLTNGALLTGFTLTNGATQSSGDQYKQMSGGGVWCESGGVMVSNCVLAGNSAYSSSGAAWSGMLNDCTLTGNSAPSGGGSCRGTLNHCTLTGNSASSGGGANFATLNYCMLSGNSASSYGGGAESSTLNNSTLTGNSAARWGGGTDNCTLNNCVLRANSAEEGGGSSDGTLNNCALNGNSAVEGGGAILGTLNNCTLTGNSAVHSGGGASYSFLNNCVVYYNTAPDGNYDPNSTLRYCCTTPLPSSGTNNLAAEPQLASDSHLSINSPCRGAGSASYAGGVDIDGEPWANPPSIGCDECASGSVTGALSVAIAVSYTNVAVGFSVDFQALIGGRINASSWEFGDGAGLSNRPHASHAWFADGDYPVVLRAYNGSFPGGVAAIVIVHVVSQPVHFAALSSSSPVSPYNSWATAATNIQDAVDAATVPGALILVSNGVYQTGSRAVYAMNNRLVVTKPVAVQSANGPGVTTILGYQVPGTTNGAGAVRCVYLTNGALLAGFTLTNGATQSSGDRDRQMSGGGVWCEPGGAVVSNCVLVANSACSNGGGACFGALMDCTLNGNSAASGGGACYGLLDHCTLNTNWASSGGGACWVTLNDCTLGGNSAKNGGGAYSSTLNHCTLTTNYAGANGGGAYAGTLNDCVLNENSAWVEGGGACGGILNHCVLSDNYAAFGGGAYSGTLNNCILTGNWVYSEGGGAESSTLNNCTLTSNTAQYGGGGGTVDCTLNNCILKGNSASYNGGAWSGTLNNCTLSGNSAVSDGGGVASATLNNCIVYYNSVYYNSSSNANYLGCVMNSCCTAPAPASGPGNFTNAPLFVNLAGGDLHLQTNSPCVNAGLNTYAPGTTDLDGHPRIVDARVDIGAYECQSPPLLAYHTWLQSYGLPGDGSVDYADSDHDGMSNWQEWLAGTCPTNAASVLRLQPPVVALPGVRLRWSSDTNHAYFVQRATNLDGPLSFSLLRTNIPGLPSATAYTDTSAPSTCAAFYRVGTDSTNGSSPLSLQPPVFVPASLTLTWWSVTNRSYSLARIFHKGVEQKGGRGVRRL